MTKERFGALFEHALEEAARLAEQQLGQAIPRNFDILLYGAGHSGDRLSPAAALDSLYIDATRFYRIIDVAVSKVNKQTSVVFVRASSHRPGPFDQAWNDPAGSGPFKQIIAEKIKVSED